MKYWDEPLNPIVHSNCYCPDVGNHCWAKGGRFRPRDIQIQSGIVDWIPKKFRAVTRRGKSKIYFVCNTCDLAHESVDHSLIEWVWRELYLINTERKRNNCEPHTFLILTKWPNRLAEIIVGNDNIIVISGNPYLYIGTTITGFDEKTDRERLNGLEKFRKYYPTWLSIEPLLGEMPYLKYYLDSLSHLDGQYRDAVNTGMFNEDQVDSLRHKKISQVIVGGETGPKARPMYSLWPMQIRDMCRGAGVAFFFKSWGKHVPDAEDPRTLEGREHNDLIWRI